MDEKVMALVGAAAGVTVLGRGLRPIAKVAMHGVVAATEATAATRRGIESLYAEVKAEREGSAVDPGLKAAPEPNGPTTSASPTPG